jgi:hypothetical protein
MNDQSINSLSPGAIQLLRQAPQLIEQPKYRVFISYSHEDKDLVERIAAVLEGNGLQPMWDRNFASGQGFHSQIKKFIAHAHVFLPVLTKRADARKWVHQEIGYSLALHIPVLPIAVEKLPGGMLQQIQALWIDMNNLEGLRQQLSREVIESLIKRHSGTSEALYACADFPEDRARMITSYANDVLSLGVNDIVRQKGALSSFHIPSETIGHPNWRRRYGSVEKSEEHCRYQREERLALQQHAELAGCKLIVDPTIRYEKYGSDARICRLENFLAFLKEMDDQHCWVAIKEGMDTRLSVTLLGNWFAAESVAGSDGRGYRQTILTRHAPTVMKKISNFDDEFQELLRAAGISNTDSRRWAMNAIEKLLASLH